MVSYGGGESPNRSSFSRVLSRVPLRGSLVGLVFRVGACLKASFLKVCTIEAARTLVQLFRLLLCAFKWALGGYRGLGCLKDHRTA